MPRHSSGTGKVLPVPPLDCEEIKFWLQIMEEHALFIKTGLPFDKPDLIEEAAAFEKEFKAFRLRAEKLQSEKKFAELVADIIGTLKEFIRFKKLLLGMSLTNRLGSALPPLFFDHLIREAEYFMAILEKLRAGKKLAVVKALEVDFWLRIMADHTKFIDSRIDPSERSLIGVGRGYEVEFDDLSMQARDYVSFFEHHHNEVPAFGRFLQDSRSATMRLRDFKQAVHEMIVKCKILSTIPATMADHVRREAEHFLLVLAMMEKGVIKIESDADCFKHKHQPAFGMDLEEDFCEEELPMMDECDEIEQDIIDDIDLDCTPGAEREQETPPEESADIEEEPTCEEREEATIIPDEAEFTPDSNLEEDFEVKAKVVAAEKVVPPSKPVGGDKTKKPNKYKWSANWPRQLGKIKEEK